MAGIGVYERIGQLCSEIRSEYIKTVARQDRENRSWTRQRNMPLEDILRCTLSKKGLSATMEVRRYFQEAGKMEKTVSKQNYLKQRKKLNPEVFKLLNRNYITRFYEGQEAKEWQGYLVMAIDGSRVEIPNSKENREVYGESKTRYGKSSARASLSALHDVFNRFLVDIVIDKYLGSEIEAGKLHIEALKEIMGDRPVLIMFDRGYSSLEFMEFLENAGIKYLIRLPGRRYKAEVAGMKTSDEEVELVYTKSRLNSLKQKSSQLAEELLQKQSIRARIVKAELEKGEQVSFITNLTEGTSEDIQQLYRKRWSIEAKYHTLKNKLKFESVTGKASIYVEQDFWAQTLVFNMIQDLITGAEYPAAKKAKEKQLRYEVRINENIAIGLFKEQFIRLMLEEDDAQKEQMFRTLTTDMERNIVPVRELKSSPRKWKYYNKYDCNLKPSF